MTKIFSIHRRIEYGLDVFDVRWAQTGLLLRDGMTYDGACKLARDTEAKYKLEAALYAEYVAECARIDSKAA